MLFAAFMNVGGNGGLLGGEGQHGVVHHHVLENKKSLFQMLILKSKVILIRMIEQKG